MTYKSYKELEKEIEILRQENNILRDKNKKQGEEICHILKEVRKVDPELVRALE